MNYLKREKEGGKEREKKEERRGKGRDRREGKGKAGGIPLVNK